MIRIITTIAIACATACDLAPTGEFRSTATEPDEIGFDLRAYSAITGEEYPHAGRCSPRAAPYAGRLSWMCGIQHIHGDDDLVHIELRPIEGTCVDHRARVAGGQQEVAGAAYDPGWSIVATRMLFTHAYWPEPGCGPDTPPIRTTWPTAITAGATKVMMWLSADALPSDTQ